MADRMTVLRTLHSHTDIEDILYLLDLEYGVRRWQMDQSPILVLVRTILSQNTSDVNSGRAYEQLLSTFDSCETIAAAPVEEIAVAIKSGGLAGIKARRIKLVLQQIQQKQGSLDLAWLSQLPLEEAKAWLRQLPGVGAKTASCVLLFSLGRPALPVDTHVFRVAKRLGLINSRVSTEKAHEILEGLVPPHVIYQFHVHMVEHGRRMCKARRPLCPDCVLQEICPSYIVVQKHGEKSLDLSEKTGEPRERHVSLYTMIIHVEGKPRG